MEVSHINYPLKYHNDAFEIRSNYNIYHTYNIMYGTNQYIRMIFVSSQKNTYMTDRSKCHAHFLSEIIILKI